LSRHDDEFRAGMTGDEEGFLSRWLRRKEETRRGVEAAGDSGSPVEAGSTEVPSPQSAGKELTDADMPDIESLDGESDYAAFMSPGVSDQLRVRALRKLFHRPEFNITDGMDDYDEDYTQLAGLGDLVTHEMRRMQAREKDIDASNEVIPATEPLAAGDQESAPVDTRIAGGNVTEEGEEGDQRGENEGTRRIGKGPA
jgi:hypothetical protein